MCVEVLRLCRNEKNKYIIFIIPMVWRKLKNHVDDWYFWWLMLKAIMQRTRKILLIKNFLQLLYCRTWLVTPVSIPSQNVEEITIDCSSDQGNKSELYEFYSSDDSSIQLFKQHEPSDLTRNLYTLYRHREKFLLPFFDEMKFMVCCKSVDGLVDFFNVQYNLIDQRLFTDSSKRSFKGVLLHNNNLWICSSSTFCTS